MRFSLSLDQWLKTKKISNKLFFSSNYTQFISSNVIKEIIITMNAHWMLVQIWPVCAAVFTMASQANVWFFTRMCSFMSLQAATVTKLSITIFTFVWRDIVVAPHMNGQIIHCSKSFAAYSALQWFVIFMAFWMISQLILGFESKIANNWYFIFGILVFLLYLYGQLIWFCNVTNLPSHVLQANGFSLLCLVCKWPFKFPFVKNFQPHWSHT